MKKQFLKVAGGILLISALVSCREKVPDPEMYELGVIVRNAGNYLDNNGSISFFRREQSTAENDLFFTQNGRSLTGSVQGYTEAGSSSLILVDNSTAGQDKVEIVSRGNFQSLATIGTPDIENPRFALEVSATKAYVSCWGATGDFSNFFKNPGYVAVVDLKTNKVTKKIEVPKGAERMIRIGNEIYVGAIGGTENLTIIDGATDAVKRSVKVGISPDPIAIDANGKLWLQSDKSMVRFNTQSGTVEATLLVGTHPVKTPSKFAISPDGRSFYYVYSFYDSDDGFKQKGETYRFSIDDTSIKADKPVINRLFSGLGVDPLQGLIYGGVTPTFKQSGYVVRYRPDGSVVDSIRVDISPSEFMFK
jgi:DNA-binding beta-propeller fold protein YncE